MKTSTAFLCALALFQLTACDAVQAADPAAPETALAKPTPAQAAWQDLDFGVMFHFDLRIYNRGGQVVDTRHPHKDAAGYAAKFNPVKLDTDQWITAAKALGANHAVLVVKHELGFCLWQSDANPYSLKSIPWCNGKGDILRDFVASCKKYGITPSVYTEIRCDARLGVLNFKVTANSPLSQAEYDSSTERELEELVTRYGDLCEIWYDGGAGPNAASLEANAAKHQPKMLFYHSPDPMVRSDYRWGGGREDGMVNYPCWSTADANTWDAKILRNGDVLRQERYQRHLKMGLVKDTWPLSPRVSDAPAWDKVKNYEVLSPVFAAVGIHW